MTDLPTVLTKAGLQPQSPASLRSQTEALIVSERPGYTGNLPGSLIEDMLSTEQAALVEIDAARVEIVNSLTPYGANAFLLNQLGQIYGVSIGEVSNTSVKVVFTGTPGFVIARGFTVSDGTYQYLVKNGGVIGAGGQSQPLYCYASRAGSWAIPTNTVQQLITSVPSTVSLACNNPTAGTPGGDAETESEYRVRVLQAGLAISSGMATTLKTLVAEVQGVQARLISVVQQAGGGWTVIVGGGDPYEVAYAIYTALFDISSLVGSVLSVTNITQAMNGEVITDINHGYSDGQVVNITGVVGMVPINNTPITVEVISEKVFKTGINTNGYPAYVSGGVVTPNLRNVEVSLNDYPDIYVVPFVDPPEQTVAVTLTWNTSSPNFVSSAAVAQLGNPALVEYVNSIRVGAPINVFEMQTVFQAAIASVLSPELLTRMVFAVSINGIGTEPEAGTGIIAGDPESYFLTSTASVVITQG